MYGPGPIALLLGAPTLILIYFLWCRVSPRQARACLARPKGRNLCCGAKGPKTIDVPSGLICEDATLQRADQLAPLKQGPPSDESIPSIEADGRRRPCKTNLSGSLMKERRSPHQGFPNSS